jgi:hypothetical protein
LCAISHIFRCSMFGIVTNQRNAVLMSAMCDIGSYGITDQ